MADAATLFRDVAAFAEHVGRPLSERQIPDLRAIQDYKFTTIRGPRQSGKSQSMGVYGLWWAMRKPQQNVLILSAGDAAAKRVLDAIRRMAAESPTLAGVVVSDKVHELRLSNGSVISSVPASEAQIRGQSIDLLLVDEAQLIKDDILVSAALPTVTARPDARIVLAGTAGRASGTFYNFATYGDEGRPEHHACCWRLEDCPWIEPSFIETMRAGMSATRFAAEYECEFQSGLDSLFSKALLDRATANFRPGVLGQSHGAVRMFGGVDWGATYDRSALVTVGRLAYTNADQPMFGVSLAHRWDEGYELAQVVEEIATTPILIRRLTAEKNGIGEAPVQMLDRAIRRRAPAAGGGRSGNRFVVVDDTRPLKSRRRSPWDRQRAQEFRTKLEPLHTTAQTKAAQFGALHLLLQRGQLLISADDTELLRELLFLRVALTERGHERVEAATDEGSGHDDLADALGMSLGPYRRKDGRWLTYVGQLAEPDWKQPAAPPPLPGGRGLDMVESGGGVLVPRTPVWQSVLSDELSDTNLSKPPPRTVGGFTINPGAIR